MSMEPLATTWGRLAAPFLDALAVCSTGPAFAARLCTCSLASWSTFQPESQPHLAPAHDQGLWGCGQDGKETGVSGLTPGWLPSCTYALSQIPEEWDQLPCPTVPCVLGCGHLCAGRLPLCRLCCCTLLLGSSVTPSRKSAKP